MTPPPRPEFVRLYPEIGQAGSLQIAMQAALDQAGYDLTALLTGAPGWWDCATCVDDGNRYTSIVLGSHDLIEAAYAQPQLRGLFPFTSHRSLLLSRCTRFPFTNDLPMITPVADGVYEVAWPTDSPYGSGTIGRAETPQDAIALVVSRLPASHRPAVDATANELDKIDST